jgi:hypothetical protein
VKCYNGVSVRLRIRSHLSVYPGDSYMLTILWRCSGDVKKYQHSINIQLVYSNWRNDV